LVNESDQEKQRAVHETHGFVEPGFEPVADAFASTLHDPHSGGALSVRVDGELVVDL
jgi:CubicO group peptidase (beta-lactamase class C family)